MTKERIGDFRSTLNEIVKRKKLDENESLYESSKIESAP
jgi:hypothetical protein